MDYFRFLFLYLRTVRSVRDRWLSTFAFCREVGAVFICLFKLQLILIELLCGNERKLGGGEPISNQSAFIYPNRVECWDGDGGDAAVVHGSVGQPDLQPLRGRPAHDQIPHRSSPSPGVQSSQQRHVRLHPRSGPSLKSPSQVAFSPTHAFTTIKNGNK